MCYVDVFIYFLNCDNEVCSGNFEEAQKQSGSKILTIATYVCSNYCCHVMIQLCKKRKKKRKNHNNNNNNKTSQRLELKHQRHINTLALVEGRGVGQ